MYKFKDYDFICRYIDSSVTKEQLEVCRKMVNKYGQKHTKNYLYDALGQKWAKRWMEYTRI